MAYTQVADAIVPPYSRPRPVPEFDRAKALRSWLVAWTAWMTVDPDRAAFRHYDVR
jgi:hypothetical protein